MIQRLYQHPPCPKSLAPMHLVEPPASQKFYMTRFGRWLCALEGHRPCTPKVQPVLEADKDALTYHVWAWCSRCWMCSEHRLHFDREFKVLHTEEKAEFVIRGRVNAARAAIYDEMLASQNAALAKLWLPKRKRILAWELAPQLFDVVQLEYPDDLPFTTDAEIVLAMRILSQPPKYEADDREDDDA